MLETRLKMGPLTKLCRPVLALGLACALGGFVTAGCVDNSGNKTYPRADAGATDGGDDVSVSDDATTATDAPAADAPPADAPAADTHPADAPAADTHAGGDAGPDVSLPVDASGQDVRLDSGAGG